MRNETVRMFINIWGSHLWYFFTLTLSCQPYEFSQVPRSCSQIISCTLSVSFICSWGTYGRWLTAAAMIFLISSSMSAPSFAVVRAEWEDKGYVIANRYLVSLQANHYLYCRLFSRLLARFEKIVERNITAF